MSGPLLAVDAPSLLYRAFFALPKSITGADGSRQRAARDDQPCPVGGRAPRAARRRAVLRRRGGGLPRGASARLPRRPPAEMPDELGRSGRRAGVLRRVRLDRRRPTSSRPTTCSAPARSRRPPAARRCCSPATATCSSAWASGAVLFPGRQGRPGAHRRAGVESALRHRTRAGPGLHRAARRPVGRDARREGHRREDRRRAAARPRTLEGAIANAGQERPRVAAALRDQADELRASAR